MLSLFYARYRLYRPQLSPCIIFYVFIMVQFSGLIVVLLDSPRLSSSSSCICSLLYLCYTLLPPECFLELSSYFSSPSISLLSSLRYPSFLARCLLSPVIDFRPFAISPSGFWTFFPPAIAPPNIALLHRNWSWTSLQFTGYALMALVV